MYTPLPRSILIFLSCVLTHVQMESLWGRRSNSNLLHLHYSFPPFSVGEIGKQGMPNRREVGHGNLARAGIAGTHALVATASCLGYVWCWRFYCSQTSMLQEWSYGLLSQQTDMYVHDWCLSRPCDCLPDSCSGVYTGYLLVHSNPSVCNMLLLCYRLDAK
jgi:hypothetical protein